MEAVEQRVSSRRRYFIDRSLVVGATHVCGAIQIAVVGLHEDPYWLGTVRGIAVEIVQDGNRSTGSHFVDDAAARTAGTATAESSISVEVAIGALHRQIGSAAVGKVKIPTDGESTPCRD